MEKHNLGIYSILKDAEKGGKREKIVEGSRQEESEGTECRSEGERGRRNQRKEEGGRRWGRTRGRKVKEGRGRGRTGYQKISEARRNLKMGVEKRR